MIDPWERQQAVPKGLIAHRVSLDRMSYGSFGSRLPPRRSICSDGHAVTIPKRRDAIGRSANRMHPRQVRSRTRSGDAEPGVAEPSSSSAIIEVAGETTHP